MDWDRFFAGVGPGFFLQWGMHEAAKANPRAAIVVVSNSIGPVCGMHPEDWDGTTVKLLADDGKCGLGG